MSFSLDQFQEKLFFFLESEVILVSITNEKICRDSAKASDEAIVHSSTAYPVQLLSYLYLIHH